jgi:ABC-2 type transport system ATP-binding protein
MMVTHQMEEVEKLCNRALLLKDGKAEAYGSIDSIKEDFGGQRIILRFAGTLPRRPQLYDVTKQAATYAELNPKDGIEPQRILRELADHPDIKINTFDVQRPSLDDIFVTIYGRSAAEEEVKNA